MTQFPGLFPVGLTALFCVFGIGGGPSRKRDHLTTREALPPPGFFRDAMYVIVELGRELPFDLSHFISRVRDHLRSPSVVLAYKSQVEHSHPLDMCRQS